MDPIGKTIRGCLLGCGLLLTVSALASPLYDDNAVLELMLRGPFGLLFEDKESREYRPFVLEADGARHDIEVRLRGHSRLRVCDFPLLRLRFPEQGDPGGVFEGQRRIKLVTHCRNYDRGEQDMLEEYLAYRVFNVLTDDSYRVRLFRIRYEDTMGRLPGEAARRYGFAIESPAEFEKRTAARAVTLPGVPKNRHDLEQAALVYIFEFLVANTDWSLVTADYDEGCCHNIDLYDRDGRVILVPYDFDLTGVVNAFYAFPDERLRIRRVTQRLYRGICTDQEVLRRAIRHVASRREQILAVTGSIPGLTAKNTERARDYLESFFEKTENEDKLLRLFERRCIGRAAE